MDDIVMIPVNSRIATHVGYNVAAKALVYRHHNQKHTTFKNVPEDVGQAAISADSIGSFYHSNVKDQYEFETI